MDRWHFASWCRPGYYATAAAAAELVGCYRIGGMSARPGHPLLASVLCASSTLFAPPPSVDAAGDCAGPGGGCVSTRFDEARRGNNVSCVVCNFLLFWGVFCAAAPAADGASVPSGTGAANGPVAQKRVHGPLLMFGTSPPEPAATFFFSLLLSFYH